MSSKSEEERAYYWFKDHEKKHLAIEFGIKTAALSIPPILADYFDRHSMSYYAFRGWSDGMFWFCYFFYGLYLFLILWFVPFVKRGGSKGVRLIKFVLMPCVLLIVPDMIISIYYGGSFYFFRYLFERFSDPDRIALIS